MRIITYKTRYTGTCIYVPVPGTILSSQEIFIQSKKLVLQKPIILRLM